MFVFFNKITKKIEGYVENHTKIDTVIFDHIELDSKDHAFAICNRHNYVLDNKTIFCGNYLKSTGEYHEFPNIDNFDLYTDDIPPVDIQNYYYDNGWVLKDIVQKKHKKLQELQVNYYRALQVNVTNGVNFTVDMRSKDGTALLQIINDARNSFIEDNIAKQIQTFYVSEDLNGVKSQQEIPMLNWLWWYIFGELPDYHKACRQLYDNLTLSIDACTTDDELESIPIEYPHPNGVDIHIPNAIKYIVTHTQDTVNNVDIIFPKYVKEAIDTSRREFFSKANTSYVFSKINGIIESSFFEKAKI